MPMINGPAAFDPMLGKMRTKDVSGGTASGDYTFNNTEFTVGVAGLVSLNQVPASKLDTVSDIVNVTGTSVTLQPNIAYKIYATSQAITLNANPPASGKWAYEGHIELFVAGTGYVVTGSNVVLANALEPDAVNNCTVRFHDGIAIISVEDHVAGYIVTVASGTTAGSLYYGLATAPEAYIAVDASLNGTTIDLSGSTANGEKHVVGNSYNDTILTGSVDCGTSKFTVANLSLQDVVVNGGTMTLGDAFIPSGSTVAVSGGGLAVEKVAGNGGVIDLGGTQINITAGTINASNVIISGGAGNGGAMYLAYTANANMVDVSFTNNTAGAGYGGAVYLAYTANGVMPHFSGCEFSGNTAAAGKAMYIYYANATLTDCSFDEEQSIVVRSATVFLGGTFKTKSTIGMHNSSGSVTISSGAILDLTGNTNATPIAPGGGVTFAPGGATILTGATAGVVDAQYMLGGMTVPQIGNTNVVNLNSSNVVISSGTTASANGCTFTGGINAQGGVIFARGNANVSLQDCIASGNSGHNGNVVYAYEAATVDLSGCTITNNSSVYRGGVFYLAPGNPQINVSDCLLSGEATSGGLAYIASGSLNLLGGNSAFGTVAGSGALNFGGSNFFGGSFQPGANCSVTISSGASINLTSSINPGGGITVLEGGCTVNGNAIAAGTYTSIDSTGTPT